MANDYTLSRTENDIAGLRAEIDSAKTLLPYADGSSNVDRLCSFIDDNNREPQITSADHEEQRNAQFLANLRQQASMVVQNDLFGPRIGDKLSRTVLRETLPIEFSEYDDRADLVATRHMTVHVAVRLEAHVGAVESEHDAFLDIVSQYHDDTLMLPERTTTIQLRQDGKSTAPTSVEIEDLMMSMSEVLFEGIKNVRHDELNRFRGMVEDFVFGVFTRHRDDPVFRTFEVYANRFSCQKGQSLFRRHTPVFFDKRSEERYRLACLAFEKSLV